MNKLLAVVFGEEKSAYEGVQALSALDREGSKEKGHAKAAIEARISRLRDEYQRRQHV